ncbi:hypothetical protein NAPIS_ORF00858 [Vairimorpha apis BRL 01]|uniref:Uncharacterized protein n=1 Tax=Vairimorpha apis BRL 01 TaxID=1037528 RepID=T0MEN3_9MICR|nr:hypothetical protein NAPIS_ORF00858 [Vairimorpha apis BRL 01]
MNIIFLFSIILSTQSLPEPETPIQKITGMCKKHYETVVYQVKEKIHDVKNHTYNLFNNLKEKINGIKNRGKVEVEDQDSKMKNDFDIEEFLRHFKEKLNMKIDSSDAEDEDVERNEEDDNENDERAL